MTINATPAVLAATLAGGGLSVLPDFLVADALQSGTLVQVLPDWSLPLGGIHAVYPAARFRPPKVTAFVAMLASEVKPQPSVPGGASALGPELAAAGLIWSIWRERALRIRGHPYGPQWTPAWSVWLPCHT